MKSLETLNRPSCVEDKSREKDWVETIAFGSGVTEFEALKRIRRNNSLPIEENIILDYGEEFEDGSRALLFSAETIKVYPRFNANTCLLAQASPNFEGPRGPRPSLASMINILNLSSLNEDKVVDKKVFYRSCGHVSNYLLDLKLTASNPQDHNSQVEFSDEDIRRGIYIPRTVDKHSSAAIGIIFAAGHLRDNTFEMQFLPEKQEFYENTVRIVFEQAFNFPADQEIKPYTHVGDSADYDLSRLTYGSKALATYLVNQLHYPKAQKEKREMTVPNWIKFGRKEFKDEFLKHFLALAATITNRETINIISLSKPLLINIRDLIKEQVLDETSMWFTKNRNSHVLSLGKDAAQKLYIAGFLNLNPKVKLQAEQYLRSQLN